MHELACIFIVMFVNTISSVSVTTLYDDGLCGSLQYVPYRNVRGVHGTSPLLVLKSETRYVIIRGVVSPP